MIEKYHEKAKANHAVVRHSYLRHATAETNGIRSSRKLEWTLLQLIW